MQVKPSQKSLLRIENLYKSFGGVQALNKAQIEIFPGEIHALLGENGAGKSTLVKIIAGALQKDEGQIYWEGKPIEINSLS
jgi:ribose transport system ATP-binding protein